MSLILTFSKPKIWVKTWGHNSVIDLMHCAEHTELTMADFCDMVRYVLTNTNLDPDDPRCKLVLDIIRIKEVPGYGGSGQHYELKENENQATTQTGIMDLRKPPEPFPKMKPEDCIIQGNPGFGPLEEVDKKGE